jgi:hypothetical protein
MTKKPRIYVAGPMRGYPEFNYPKFNGFASELAGAGWDIVNPVRVGESIADAEAINSDPALLEAVLAAEILALKTCEAIYLLNGWEKSDGARKEVAAAIAHGLMIYFEPVIPLATTNPHKTTSES